MQDPDEQKGEMIEANEDKGSDFENLEDEKEG